MGDVRGPQQHCSPRSEKASNDYVDLTTVREKHNTSVAKLTYKDW